MAKISLSAAVMTRLYFYFFVFNLDPFFLLQPTQAPFRHGHVHPLPLVNFLPLGDLSSSLQFFLPFLLLIRPRVPIRDVKSGSPTS
ncbi:hypothetical protein F4813DRAFT_371086 [Daldinia decipiens]|uniref:uncharacterized protein n=1 Tax=Daldinia decipiens TaxID=326647 RepID=UPI0020C397B2|nr:uncharacterized protein F4813DRAFT_371086 [Daldinia decipiens]KAI1654482.1 hypothetical protein F4813DRAFT_371086 [Daldinia decipiens]